MHKPKKQLTIFGLKLPNVPSGDISWAKTAIIIFATFVQGALTLASLYLGMSYGDLQPFSLTVTGTGWYVVLVKAVLDYKGD